MYHITKKDSVSVTIHKTLVNDPRLTPADKGLFLFLWSKSKETQLTLTSISNENNCGLQSLKTSFKNLEKYRYIKYRKEGSYFWLDDNPSNVDMPKQIDTPVKVVNKRVKLTDEQIATRNKETKSKFLEHTKAAVYKLEKNPKYAKGIDRELIKRFIDYWTEIDSLKPENGLKFQEKSKFMHTRRLANFLYLDKKRNDTKDKL